MRTVLEIILLSLGMITLAFSIQHKRLPRGIVEWIVWIADIVVIILRATGI